MNIIREVDETNRFTKGQLEILARFVQSRTGKRYVVGCMSCNGASLYRKLKSEVELIRAKA